MISWNKILLTAIETPGANPPTVFATRPLAVVSAAVFDAANSFDRLYQPYVTWVNVAAGASRDAAVAQAAHDALVAVMPSQTGRVRLRAGLRRSPAFRRRPRPTAPPWAPRRPRPSSSARTGDGWEQPFPPLVLPSLPGYWKPTPPANLAAAFTNYPERAAASSSPTAAAS